MENKIVPQKTSDENPAVGQKEKESRAKIEKREKCFVLCRRQAGRVAGTIQGQEFLIK